MCAEERPQRFRYLVLFWIEDALVVGCEKQGLSWLCRALFWITTVVELLGVHAEEFCDRGDPEERTILRGKLGFSDADYVIGVPALLRLEKNHLQLVDAIAMLRNRGVPARALLIGDGEMRGAIEARAREFNVESDVVMTGLQQDVRPYIAACDAMALCSFTEAFSLAAIEAMALSRPLVHSDVGGAAEMIVPGWNGFLFPVGDTRALVDELAILADRTVSRRMGKNARDVVERLFSEKTMVDRYERTLLEICGVRSS